jgi:hypothetical protein
VENIVNDVAIQSKDVRPSNSVTESGQCGGQSELNDISDSCVSEDAGCQWNFVCEMNDDYDCNINCLQVKRRTNTELHVNNWDGCEAQFVSQVPFDIDGFCKFIVNCSRQDMMHYARDGRPWNTWVTSSRKGFSGIRRVARCRGSRICSSSDCSFLKHGTGPNRSHFEFVDGCLKCFTCGCEAEQVACSAVKVVEYDNIASCLTVMHTGIHACKAKLPKINRAVILKAVAENPGVKPSKLVNDKMIQVMNSEEFDWKQVESVARAFTDLKRVHNARAQIQSMNNPYGQAFEALGVFKTKCDEKDKFLVYRINCRQHNGKPSYVFKSSMHMAEIALSMDRTGNGSMSHEYAHVDAMHDRCRDFKTVILWAYHEMSRKLVCLAVMDIEEENTENLTTFWHLLDEMLAEVSGKAEYKFNPTGFVADEHHANWRSINDVFGPEAADRTVSCEFHFKQSVHRHARRMASDSAEFVNLANALLTAQTEKEFDKLCIDAERLLSHHTQLYSWFQWWIERKNHIFSAFKPHDAPSTNLAEIGHSKLSSVGRRHMSLLEAAREDVALAVRQNVDLECFREGLVAGGRGQSCVQRKAKMYKADMKRAAAYAADIDEHVLPFNQRRTFIPRSGLHRPEEREKYSTAISNSKKKLLTVNRKSVTGKKMLLQAKGRLHDVAKANIRDQTNVAKKRYPQLKKQFHKSRQNCIVSSVVQASRGAACIRKRIIRPPVRYDNNPQVASDPEKDKSVSQMTFTVVFLTSLPNVRACYGCGTAFAMKYRNRPNDLILRTFCRRRYVDKSGIEKVSSRTTAAYCHLKMACVHKVQPATQASIVNVHFFPCLNETRC